MVADGTEILDVHVREHAAALNGQTNQSGRYHVADVFPDGNPCNDAWFDSLVPAFKEAERRRESYRARGYRSGFCVCCWDVENDGEQVSECDYEDAIFIGPLQEAS